MPVCNSESFQVYLNEFSKQNRNELKVMVLDNGAFHKTKTLQIPKNIILIFLPPYSPELNPAEKIWAKFKRAFSNNFFNNLENLQAFVATLSNSLEKQEVKSISQFEYISSCPVWSV